MPTPRRYEGARKRTIKKQKRKRGELVEVEETVYGFKLVALYEVGLRQVVAVKVSKINPHDSTFTLELFEQARCNLGPEAVKLLLVDRGFLDGETLWKLKVELDIDFVVPAKRNMRINQDALSLAAEKPDEDYIFSAQRLGDEQERGEVQLRGFCGLITYEQYSDAKHQQQINRNDFQPNPINALLIQSYNGKAAEVGKEKVFPSNLPINDQLLIYDTYGLRGLIENCLFCKLKQGWNLPSFPKKAEDEGNHVYLTVLTFNLVNAYRTEQGQGLAEQGLRCKRPLWQDSNRVLFIAGEHYAIFEEELLILRGCEPEVCWRVDPDRVRREYGLDALPRAA